MSRARTPRFEGLTPQQERVLSEIAIGNDGMHHPATITALLQRELIVRVKEDWGRGLAVWRYYLPIPVHMRWCAWCAEHADSDEVPA